MSRGLSITNYLPIARQESAAIQEESAEPVESPIGTPELAKVLAGAPDDGIFVVPTAVSRPVYTYHELQADLVDSKWRFRPCRQKARDALHAVIAEWQDYYCETESHVFDPTRGKTASVVLRKKVRCRLGVKEGRVGNPLVMWLIWMLIKAFMFWWLNRDKHERGGILKDLHVNMGLLP